MEQKRIVIIQRFFPNFREGFFDNLFLRGDIKLITYPKSIGKIKVPLNVQAKKYLYVPLSVVINKNYVLFIFLFFSLIRNKPYFIVTEGGSNTINNFFVLIYCKLFKCKYAVWDLGKSYKNFGESIFRRLYNKLYKIIIKYSDFIFTYNSTSEKYFRERYSDKRICVLNNTVDTNKIRKIKQDIDFLRIKAMEKRFEGYKYLYMYVGAINKNKNLENLFKIHSKLSGDYALIVVGAGDEKYIEKLLDIYDKNIYFEGYKNLEELAYYYKIIDFVILPGLGGLTIPQSMAFSKPVVCSGADGTEIDMVRNKITGYIYNNIEDAVNFITTQTKENWERMGNTAETLIYSNFSIDNMVDNFFSCIK